MAKPKHGEYLLDVKLVIRNRRYLLNSGILSNARNYGNFVIWPNRLGVFSRIYALNGSMI